MITKIVVWAVTAVLLGYDVLAGKLGQPTESMVLRDWTRDWTVLPFIAGFLAGHWFGPRQSVDVSGWMWSLPALAILLASDLVWNLKFAQSTPPWWRYSLLYVLAGIPVGMYVWG